MSLGDELPPLIDASELETFPPVRHAFAYGSRVFSQPGAAALQDEPPLLDLLFAVDDAESWHAANLAANRLHYSPALRLLGPRAVVSLSEGVGAGVHFNAFAPLSSGLCKYGVISSSRLLSDLLHWDSLYVAGRMQKPVATLASCKRVAAASERNLQAALACALLLLPARFSELQLHAELCGLSYTGDVRMGVAEDAAKVSRLASGSAEGLRRLYRRAIERAGASRAGLSPCASGGGWTQLQDAEARSELVLDLPSTLLSKLTLAVGHDPLAMPLQHSAAARRVAAAVAASPSMGGLLRGALGRIVGASSRRQAMAGLLGSGLGTAARYVGAKVRKAWRSRGAAEVAL